MMNRFNAHDQHGPSGHDTPTEKASDRSSRRPDHGNHYGVGWQSMATPIAVIDHCVCKNPCGNRTLESWRIALDRSWDARERSIRGNQYQNTHHSLQSGEAVHATGVEDVYPRSGSGSHHFVCERYLRISRAHSNCGACLILVTADVIDPLMWSGTSCSSTIHANDWLRNPVVTSLVRVLVGRLFPRSVDCSPEASFHTGFPTKTCDEWSRRDDSRRWSSCSGNMSDAALSQAAVSCMAVGMHLCFVDPEAEINDLGFEFAVEDVIAEQRVARSVRIQHLLTPSVMACRAHCRGMSNAGPCADWQLEQQFAVLMPIVTKLQPRGRHISMICERAAAPAMQACCFWPSILVMAEAEACSPGSQFITDCWCGRHDDLGVEHRLLRDIQAYLKDRTARRTPAYCLCRAYQQFHQALAPLIRKTIRLHRIPEHAIDDCAQEVWVAVISSLETFDLTPQRGTFRAWLWSVIRHKATDFSRREARRPQTRIDELTEPLCSDEPNPAEVYESRRRVRIVRESLAELHQEIPATSYQVFSQRWVDGDDVAEIATALNLNRKGVRNRTHRAKQKMRKLLEEKAVWLDERTVGASRERVARHITPRNPR